MNIPVRTIEISFGKQTPLADRNGRQIDAMRGGRGRCGDGSEAGFCSFMRICAYAHMIYYRRPRSKIVRCNLDHHQMRCRGRGAGSQIAIKGISQSDEPLHRELPPLMPQARRRPKPRAA
jgi:hypothetical protein